MKRKEKYANRTAEQKEQDKQKSKERYQNIQKNIENQNEEDQITHMLEACKIEMKKFREFCCTVCHKMWRSIGVRKLDKKSEETLKAMKNPVTIKMINDCLKFKPLGYEDGKWICHTCFRNLKNAKMPAQAIANDLELKSLPHELDVCDLEARFVAQSIPFSKIVSLKGGSYTGVKGESCCVPIEPDRVVTTVKSLPRRLDDADIVPLKLKRRLRFHGYHMHQLIRPSKVETAFHWLVQNNPFYKRNIAFNADWYKLSKTDEMSENLKSLLSQNLEDIPEVEEHEDNRETCQSGSTNTVLSEGIEDEVDGKNLLYDTMFVDEVPTLPVREDKTSFSIAPGEGKKLISKRLEHMHQLAFPKIFPYGECSLEIDRKVKLTTRRYYNSLILRQNSRCTSSEFIFYALDRIESEQLQSSINFQSNKGFAGDLQRKGIEEALRSNKAWTVFKQVRTTPGYWDTAKKEVMAMITQRGPFSFFLTFSANDLNWVTPIKLVAAQAGVKLSDEEVKSMPFLERVKWINKNPAAVTIYLYDVFHRLMFEFILKTKVFGKVSDYVVKVEFQQRGTPHIHLILWVEDAPTPGVDSDEKVVEFIDKYITSSIPRNENDPLYHLVTTCQVHKCLKTKCRSKKKVLCKYGFPRLPSDSTCISKGQDTEEYENLSSALKETINLQFCAVKTALQDKGTEFEKLDDFLGNIDISKEQYELVKTFGHKQPTVINKRKPNECWINCYNPYTLELMESNQDIAFTLSMYGCLCYLLSYLVKAERNISKLMREAMLKENEESAKLLSNMRSIWMNKREMSYPEAIFHLLSLPLLFKSRDVVYLAADFPENRVRRIKNFSPPSEG